MVVFDRTRTALKIVEPRQTALDVFTIAHNDRKHEQPKTKLIILSTTQNKNTMPIMNKLTSLLVTAYVMIQSSFTFAFQTITPPMFRRMMIVGATTKTASTMEGASMKSLPDGVVKYSQVPKGKVFTSTTIPRGLLKEHTTKAGTWGVINVSKGQLQYQINEPSKTIHILDSKKHGIIEPQIKHEVSPLSDDVEFIVEFYRYPNTGPVIEKREGLAE